MNKVDFSEPLFFLNNVGMHPFKENKFTKLRQLFAILVYIITISSGILELIFHSEGIKTFARASDTIIPQCQLIVKMAVLIIYKKKIGKLLKTSKQFWNFQKFGKNYETSMGKIHLYLQKFFFVYKVMIAFTCLQFVAVKIIFQNKKPVTISYGENEEYNVIYDRCYLFLHTCITLVSINLINGFDGLFFYSIGHIITELQMVKIAFGNLKISPQWNNKKRFQEAVKHHTQVLEFAHNSNEIFSLVLLVQHLSCLFGICSGLFLMSKDGMPPSLDRLAKYLPYVLTFVLQTWTFCWTGHLLSVWSLDIPNEIFYIDWSDNFIYQSRNDRLISIQRGQKPVVLTLGGFGNLDLNSFKLVMQKTFSFFTFINTMMNQ